MKYVLIYGPPGAGKSTIADHLAGRTGWPQIDNDLTTQLATSLFAYGTKEYAQLIADLRLQMLRAAVDGACAGLIQTLVYSPERKGRVDEILGYLASNDTEIWGVRLYSNVLTLQERVTTRKVPRVPKIDSAEKFDSAMLKLQDPFAVIPNIPTLEFDTEWMSAMNVVEMIIQSLSDPSSKRWVLASE